MPTITASTNGGYIIANNHSSHANARNADTGNTIVANASRAQNSFGYVRSAGRSGTAYAIYRSFLQFITKKNASAASSEYKNSL